VTTTRAASVFGKIDAAKRTQDFIAAREVVEIASGLHRKNKSAQPAFCFGGSMAITCQF